MKKTKETHGRLFLLQSSGREREGRRGCRDTALVQVRVGRVVSTDVCYGRWYEQPRDQQVLTHTNVLALCDISAVAEAKDQRHCPPSSPRATPSTSACRPLKPIPLTMLPTAGAAVYEPQRAEPSETRPDRHLSKRSIHPPTPADRTGRSDQLACHAMPSLKPLPSAQTPDA